MDGEHLIYLYCVTAQPPDLESVQVSWASSPRFEGGTPSTQGLGELHVVREAGLCAVVSQVEAGAFEPSSLRRRLEDLDWVAAETTKHERIVEAVMRDRCVIPFRFAALFHTDENLRTQLRAHCDEFQGLLEELEDKAEWGVKVYCDVPKLRSVLCDQDGSVSGLNEAIRSASPGKAFFLEKKREESAKAALAGRIDRYMEQAVEALQTVSIQTRINKVLPREATKRRDAMILNAAFLVANHDGRAFMDTASALNERYADQSLFVECSGPWPPYNFCDLARKVANG
jgi:hypothetical protein